MSNMYNPSLREEPRHQLAALIPLQQEPSILDWLESTGRLLARDVQAEDSFRDGDAEISDLMAPDDVYDDLEDDDEIIDVDED